jgi:predicted nucleotidyltransferase component of viral defense system
LTLKGGTSLRKIYFPDHRLSEDLDFTYRGENFKTEEIKKHFQKKVFHFPKIIGLGVFKRLNAVINYF